MADYSGFNWESHQQYIIESFYKGPDSPSREMSDQDIKFSIACGHKALKELTDLKKSLASMKRLLGND